MLAQNRQWAAPEWHWEKEHAVNVTIRLYAMGVALGARPAPAGEAEQPVGDPCTG